MWCIFCYKLFSTFQTQGEGRKFTFENWFGGEKKFIFFFIKVFQNLKESCMSTFFFPRLYSFDASDITRNGKRRNWHLGIYLYVYSA